MFLLNTVQKDLTEQLLTGIDWRDRETKKALQWWEWGGGKGQF